MEGVVEDDDGRAAGRGARDLHGVLVRLGARVDEDRLLLGARARRELGEQPARLDVRLVDADHEALVEVLVRLPVDRLDDGREAVTGVLAADPAGEVDEHPAVGVGDARAVRARDDEPRRRDPARHVAPPLGEDPLGGVLLYRRHAREYDASSRRAKRVHRLRRAGPRIARGSRCGRPLLRPRSGRLQGSAPAKPGIEPQDSATAESRWRTPATCGLPHHAP